MDLLELLTDQLRDVYDAEKQLTKALPRMAKAVRNEEELSQGFRDHAAQTQEHVQRIEQAFQTLGMKARGKPCAGMKGLMEEGQEIMQQEKDSDSLALALSSAARKVEHYEMMAYESLISAAQAAKQPEVVQLLRQTLQEEAETDKRLSTIGKRLVKEAMQQARESGRQSSAQTSGGQASGGKTSGGKSNGAKSRGNGRNQGKQGSESHLSRTTTDHDEIRRWAEERGGRPACVKGTGNRGDIGLLRLEFPGKPNANDQKLTPIDWEDFFDKFEERGLALVYQEQTADGQESNFNKLIAREGGAKPKARAAR